MDYGLELKTIVRQAVPKAFLPQSSRTKSLVPTFPLHLSLEFHIHFLIRKVYPPTVMEHDLFDPADAAELHQHGYLGPVTGGKRKASVASILTTSTELSSGTSTSASSVGSNTIDVPISIRSHDAFEFVGLTKTTATQLWQRYCNIPADLTGIDGPVLRVP